MRKDTRRPNTPPTGEDAKRTEGSPCRIPGDGIGRDMGGGEIYVEISS